jgi:hypothetical protein
MCNDIPVGMRGHMAPPSRSNPTPSRKIPIVMAPEQTSVGVFEPSIMDVGCHSALFGTPHYISVWPTDVPLTPALLASVLLSNPSGSAMLVAGADPEMDKVVVWASPLDAMMYVQGAVLAGMTDRAEKLVESLNSKYPYFYNNDGDSVWPQLLACAAASGDKDTVMWAYGHCIEGRPEGRPEAMFAQRYLRIIVSTAAAFGHVALIEPIGDGRENLVQRLIRLCSDDGGDENPPQIFRHNPYNVVMNLCGVVSDGCETAEDVAALDAFALKYVKLCGSISAVVGSDSVLQAAIGAAIEKRLDTLAAYIVETLSANPKHDGSWLYSHGALGRVIGNGCHETLKAIYKITPVVADGPHPWAVWGRQFAFWSACEFSRRGNGNDNGNDVGYQYGRKKRFIDGGKMGVTLCLTFLNRCVFGTDASGSGSGDSSGSGASASVSPTLHIPLATMKILNRIGGSDDDDDTSENDDSSVV